jgi:hypothetical protein
VRTAEDFMVFLGSSLGYTKTFPWRVVTAAGEDLLLLNKNKIGVSISGKFLSSDGKIIATIENNKFRINERNYFEIKRPNKHSLIVYDQEGTKALDIYYLNPNVVKILGVFRQMNTPPLIVNEDEIIFGSNILKMQCYGRPSRGFLSLN